MTVLRRRMCHKGMLDPYRPALTMSCVCVASSSYCWRKRKGKEIKGCTIQWSRRVYVVFVLPKIDLLKWMWLLSISNQTGKQGKSLHKSLSISPHPQKIALKLEITPTIKIKRTIQGSIHCFYYHLFREHKGGNIHWFLIVAKQEQKRQENFCQESSLLLWPI